jgi:hypothetical protein
LQLIIDSTNENNNCNIEVSDKVFNTNTSGRGTAYNHKIRQVYYTLCSIGSVLARIYTGIQILYQYGRQLIGKMHKINYIKFCSILDCYFLFLDNNLY